MFHFLKNKLFPAKEAIVNLFRYPRERIGVTPTYDAYWRSKRGENIGALSDWQKNRADIILKNMPRGENVSVLDIGCGDGAILNYVKRKLGNTAGLYGIDASDFSLSRAEKFGIKIFKKDVSKISKFDFVDEKIDYIFLLEVVEHVQNSEKLVAAAFEKSEKGVFVSVPNTGYFLHRLRLLLGRFPLQWREHPSEHVRFWTRRDMVWWLDALGYENREIFVYKGIPVANKIFPSLFGAGMIVFIKKEEKNHQR